MFTGFSCRARFAADAAVLGIVVCGDAGTTAVFLGGRASARAVVAQLSVAAFAVVAARRACFRRGCAARAEKKNTKNEEARSGTHTFILGLGGQGFFFGCKYIEECFPTHDSAMCDKSKRVDGIRAKQPNESVGLFGLRSREVDSLGWLC